MKLKLFASSLCLFIGLTLFAQNRQNNQNKENRQFPSEEMIKELNLSEKQVTEWKEIQEKNFKAMQEQRDQNKKQDNADREERRKNFDEMRKAHREEIKKILSEEQYVKYLEIEKDRQNRSGKNSRK